MNIKPLTGAVFVISRPVSHPFCFTKFALALEVCMLAASLAMVVTQVLSYKAGFMHCPYSRFRTNLLYFTKSILTQGAIKSAKCKKLTKILKQDKDCNLKQMELHHFNISELVS